MSKKIISKITSVTILCTMLTYTIPVFAFTKDETVYSKINSDGDTYNTIVSDHIKNEGQEQVINDISDLLNIKNVNGDEEFSQDGNELVWSANGSDIYYQGESQKELPIECNVKYELDGEEITSQDLAGKSGKVKITIEYVNKDEHVVNINGRDEKLYTPFVVICGTILDNKTHKNIEITNGKIIDNGNKTIVVGMSLPGMQESLNISKDKLDVPSTVEITMDVTDFELNNIITYVTPKILEENDLEVFDKIDEIYAMANELQSASTQLVDGSVQLKYGMNQLRNGTYELSNNLNLKINEYEKVRKQLSNKNEIENKLIEITNAEIKKLAPELETLAIQEASNVIKSNKSELEEKASQTAYKYTELAIQNVLEEIKSGNIKIEIPAELLNQITKDIEKALESVLQDQELNSLVGTVKTAIINNVQSTLQNTATVTAMQQQIDAYKTQSSSELSKIADRETLIQALVAQGKSTKEAETLVDGFAQTAVNQTLDKVEANIPTMVGNVANQIVKNLNADEAITTAISNLTGKIITKIAPTMQKAITEKLGTYLTNNTLLQEVINQNKTKLNLIIDNIAENTAQELAKEYTESLANQIATNLIKKQLRGELNATELNKELLKYESLINSELGEVDGQINILKGALSQLSNGTDELAEGATTLSDGMITFDKEGIEKICGFVNGDLNDVTARIEKLKELSKEYNNFTMLNDDNKGNVKFIMIMDSIKKSDENKQEAFIEDDKSKKD